MMIMTGYSLMAPPMNSQTKFTSLPPLPPLVELALMLAFKSPVISHKLPCLTEGLPVPRGYGRVDALLPIICRNCGRRLGSIENGLLAFPELCGKCPSSYGLGVNSFPFQLDMAKALLGDWYRFWIVTSWLDSNDWDTQDREPTDTRGIGSGSRVLGKAPLINIDSLVDSLLDIES